MKKNKVIKESTKTDDELMGRNNKNLNSYIAENFGKYKLEEPDQSSEPCKYKKKVKVRGPWDKGDNFIVPKSGNIELMMHQEFLSQFSEF